VDKQLNFEDVNDKQAVIRAIGKFNSLGRDKFLEKSGFSRATKYFVLYKGKQYDAKPILWAAFKEQFGFHLKKKSSGGVYQRVRPVFERLGFTVICSHSELDKQFQKKVINSKNDSQEQRRKRLKKASQKPRVAMVLTAVFIRNPDVVAEVLLRAGGICESCKRPAPFFKKSSSEPFLEVHHKKPLSKGGTDTVSNAIALCPNCHRKAHYG